MSEFEPVHVTAEITNFPPDKRAKERNTVSSTFLGPAGGVALVIQIAQQNPNRCKLNAILSQTNAIATCAWITHSLAGAQEIARQVAGSGVPAPDQADVAQYSGFLLGMSGLSAVPQYTTTGTGPLWAVLGIGSALSVTDETEA